MTVPTNRPLRADAARNVERILRAARETFAEIGPDASLEEVAERAGVGVATLYRRFPSKGELVRAALEQSMMQEFSPAIEEAMRGDDVRAGLTALLNAAVALAARERNTLAAARNAGAITAGLNGRFFDALVTLLDKGQETGVVRADLVPDDLPRMMVMLVGTMWTMEADSRGWERYVSLVLDGVMAVGSGPLPPTVPLPDREGWLI